MILEKATRIEIFLLNMCLLANHLPIYSITSQTLVQNMTLGLEM